MSLSKISDSIDFEEEFSNFDILGSYRINKWFCWCGCSRDKFHENSAKIPFIKHPLHSAARMPNPVTNRIQAWVQKISDSFVLEFPKTEEILAEMQNGLSCESGLSRSSFDSLSVSDGSSNIAKRNFYKGPSPPLSKASNSNSIYSSKMRVTSDEEKIFIQKRDTAMGIETLKVEKEKINEEILLMEENLKIPRHFQEIQEKLEIPSNFEEIAENLKMHLVIYNLYIEHINYLSLED